MISKNIVILFLVLFPVFKSAAQIELIISELKVSNIKAKYSDDLINEDIENGPHLLLIGVISNRSKEDITLKPSEINYSLQFNYRGRDFLKEVFPTAFSDIERVVLKANQTIEFSVDALIFLGTPLFEEKKYDYTMELLEVLPTLKFKLNHSNGLKVTSISIGKVVINK